MNEALQDRLPYAGEPLVSDESYLRRVPVALAPKERMRFDAIVTCADIITQAFHGLRHFTAEAGVDLEQLGNSGRAYALGQCWTIVDQLHAARQLLMPGAGSKAGPITQAFLDSAETATILRNKMDHLADNLDNLSKLRGSRFPLFGSLSYFYSPEATSENGHIVTIMSGALHGDDLMPCVNPFDKQFTLPTGLFTLWAFGHELDFGRAIGPFRDWLAHLGGKLEGDIRGRLAEQGATDDQVEAAMATLGGGVAFYLELEIIDEGAAE